jgi:hypothetical protein
LQLHYLDVYTAIRPYYPCWHEGLRASIGAPCRVFAASSVLARMRCGKIRIACDATMGSAVRPLPATTTATKRREKYFRRVAGFRPSRPSRAGRGRSRVIRRFADSRNRRWGLASCSMTRFSCRDLAARSFRSGCAGRASGREPSLVPPENAKRGNANGPEVRPVHCKCGWNAAALELSPRRSRAARRRRRDPAAPAAHRGRKA